MATITAAGLAVTALLVVAVGGVGQAFDSPAATDVSTTECDAGECRVGVGTTPTLPYLDPGLGAVTLTLGSTRAELHLTMYTWAAVRGSCGDEQPLVPGNESRTGATNEYEVAFEYELGEEINCTIQVAADSVTINIRFDFDALADQGIDDCIVVGEITRCETGSEWLSYEPNEVFTQPVIVVFGAEAWAEATSHLPDTSAPVTTSDS